MRRPLIGITVDNFESSMAPGKYESNIEYSRTVAAAGGLPLLMTQDVELAADFVERCDGILLTGGNDIRSDFFGVPAHPLSKCIEPERQEFEVALLCALSARPQRPVLGICMGMQMMAMYAGGRMHQHLPEILENGVVEHQDNHPHEIAIEVDESVLLTGAGVTTAETALKTVVSSHHQAVIDAGSLRVVATSIDGVIEAIDDPLRAFYLGVQWHPERSNGPLNRGLIERFVHACVPQNE